MNYLGIRMNPTAFTDASFLCLVTAGLLLASAVTLFQRDNARWSVRLLVLGSAALGFFVSTLDPFLVLWDEQYHALVARHLMDHPLRPTLYEQPLLAYDYRSWTSNHIWLHKPPLFLWQIAISLKCFGVSSLSVRIPDILMHAGATWMVFRIGKICVNERAGFYGALFFACSYHLLELGAGKFATDHNDTAFLYYVTASFWSWFEYKHTGSRRWIWLIGLFSGCAVLVKWLVGLLVFAAWSWVLVFASTTRDSRRQEINALLLAALVALMVFVPWNVFIHLNYPVEASYEMQLTTAHFFTPIENHGGGLGFHINALRDLYGAGQAIPFLLLAGLVVMLRSTQKVYRIAITAAILCTYLFYSAAATKMTSFGIIVSPFFFLGIGTLLDKALVVVSGKTQSRSLVNAFSFLLVLTSAYLVFNMKKIERYHSDARPDDNMNRAADLELMKMIKRLNELGVDKNTIVFNADVRKNGHIPVMFYTEGIAYDFIPTPEQLATVQRKSFRAFIWDDGTLPDFLINDSSVVRVKL